MTKRLGGDHQGGYGSGVTGGKKSASGYQGGGVIKFKTIAEKKDIIGGELKPMPDGYKGRVVYGGGGRKGRQEGTGPQ